MRRYRTSAATETRLDYGLELATGLKLFPETTPLAAGIDAVNTELEAANNTRRSKRTPLVKARVALRLANYETDQVIRSCARAAEIADGGRRGPVFNTLFPQGVGPVVAPAGARQIKPTEALLDRLSKSKNAAVVAFAVEWKPKLSAELTKLTAAADAHKSALKAHASDFSEELALREEHRQSVDKVMGLVRATFPNDRAKQDLVFPEMNEAEAATVDEGDESTEGAQEP
jgi:hypothetical protein